MGVIEDYNRFLERYCTKHGISKEEAETHQLVKEMKQYYEKNDDSVKVVGWKENET